MDHYIPNTRDKNLSEISDQYLYQTWGNISKRAQKHIPMDQSVYILTMDNGSE
jgi:hypothetical protein